MFKLTDPKDLEKAGRSIASLIALSVEGLEKNHSFHKTMAAHHTAMAGHHDSLSKAHSDHHAGLGNDHEDKAFHTKAASAHDALHKEHTAAAATHSGHAETMKAQLDTRKALAVEWGAVAVAAKAAAAGAGAGMGGDPIDLENVGTVDDMLKTTSQALMRKTLQSFNEDPAVKEAIRELCLKQIGGILGDKLVPDNIHGVLREFPGTQLVPRNGAPEAPVRPNVPLEFEKLVSVDDEES